MSATFDFSINGSIKDFFFDRRRVQEALTAAEKKNLSLIGSYIRQRARTRILRRRKGASDPLSPPHVHSQDSVRNLKNILFAYDPNLHAVIVGPVGLRKRVDTTEIANQTVPQILEFGGVAVIHEERYKRSTKTVWYRRDDRTKVEESKEYRTRTASYAPRPFMSVALKQEIAAGTIKNVWRASVTAGATA